MQVLLLTVCLLIFTSCGSDDTADTGPEGVATGLSSAVLDIDPGAVWNLFHPLLRTTTTRAQFTDCYTEALGTSAVAEYDLELLDTYAEGSITYVDVRATFETPEPVARAVFTVATVEFDGQWWTVGLLGDDPTEGQRCGIIEYRPTP